MRMGTCHSCGAEIGWVKTIKGKTMPVNAEPVPNGNIVIAEDGTTALVYRDAASIAPRLINDPRYVSHFSTCPQADEWRQS